MKCFGFDCARVFDRGLSFIVFAEDRLLIAFVFFQIPSIISSLVIIWTGPSNVTCHSLQPKIIRQYITVYNGINFHQLSFNQAPFDIIFGAMSDPNEAEYIQENMIDQQQQQVIMDDDHKSDFSQNFQSDEQNPHQINNEDQQKIKNIVKVPNPVSSYSVFMKDWRQKHPQQKMNMAAIGLIWKELDSHQKQIYEKKYVQQKQKYDKYIAQMLAIDPNFGKKNNLSKNFFFPLHRVRTIMKQDEYFTTSAENVTAMTKTVQYFGQYLLEQVKKSTQGKKRIDLSDLFQTVNTNQSNLWFLNCLIDQHNLGKESPSKTNHSQNKKKHIQLSKDDDEGNNRKKQAQQIQRQSQKKIEKQSRKSKVVMPQGQMKLTDMF